MKRQHELQRIGQPGSREATVQFSLVDPNNDIDEALQFTCTEFTFKEFP